MKKAMLQAAGTAVLGVALAAAAVTPAAADGLGGLAGGLQAPSVDGVPAAGLTGTHAAPGGTDGSQLLNSQSGGVKTVTGSAQDLVNTAGPSVTGATQAVSRLSTATNVSPTRSLPGGLPVALPGVGGGLPAVGSLPGVSQATQSLPVHTPLGGLNG